MSRTLPKFIRYDAVEEIVLKHPNPKWRGLPSASVRLGVTPDGHWVYATSASTGSAGYSSPLGDWTDAKRPIPGFVSRRAALDAAAIEIRRRFADKQGPSPADLRERARIREWTRELEMGQAELFATTG